MMEVRTFAADRSAPLAVVGEANLPPSLQIFAYRANRLLFSGEFNGPLEIGRQDQTQAEPAPCAELSLEDRKRLVLIAADQLEVSKRQLLLEPLEGNKARATNLSRVRSVTMREGGELDIGQVREVTLPAIMAIADVMLRVERVEPALSKAPEYFSLSGSPPVPGSMAASSTVIMPPTPISELDNDTATSLADWLQTLSVVLQSATTSNEFFAQAARAIVEMVGLDSGAVVLFEQSGPVAKAEWSRGGLPSMSNDTWGPSGRVLAKLRQEKRTFWTNPAKDNTIDGSLMHVQAVVAAPIIGPGGEVIGALYGDRHGLQMGSGEVEINKTEAMLVQALASGVAAGLARIEQEKAAIAAQVRFEQFFSAELSRHLAAEPEMLRGRDADVTILFCDIRGFSRVSHRIGPALTFDWINSVMGALSDCVSRHDGVLVDFIGDELLAMWGAPREQPNHPELACLAAMDMLSALPEINREWEAQIGATTGVGIGINSGTARVGNTGSHRRFKYGPLGNTVNLASRVQGTTKFFQVSFIITQSTRDRLTASLVPRRLCQVKVVNIDEPVTLYELRPDVDAGWREICREHERALAHFERGELQPAVTILGTLLSQQPNDGPARALLARTLDAMLSDEPFKPVWELPSK